MSQNISESRAFRNHCLFLIPSSLLLYALYSYLLRPLYNVCVADVMFAEAPRIYVVYLLDFLSRLIDYGAFCLSLAVLPYMILRFGMRRTIGPAAGCVVCSLFKYMSNLLMTWVFNRFSTLNSYSLPRDLGSVAFQTLLDALTIAIVCLVACLLLRKKKVSLLMEHQEIDGAYPGRALSFPYRKLFCFRNPLQTAALVGGGIVSLTAIVGRVMYDTLYGAPSSSAEVISMVAHYLGDLMLGLIVYMVILLIQLQLDRHAVRKQSASNE